MKTKTLEDWRREIDSLDLNLLDVLSKRFAVVKAIGKLKKEQNLTIRDDKRWQELLEQRMLAAEKHGLSKEFIEKLFEVIHEYSVELEEISSR